MIHATHPTRNRFAPLFERLVANSEPANDSAAACWIWTGPTRRHGGGDRPAVSLRTAKGPRNQNAARCMLEVFGPIADGLGASHLCSDEWLCINPDHLIAESKGANMARRWGASLGLTLAVPHLDTIDPWAGESCGNVCPF